MRIVVLGGLGVNGSWLTRRLLHEGHEVLILDDREDYSLVPELAGEVEIVLGNILDQDGLVEAFKKHRCDTVAHLAALMPAACVENPGLGLRVNAYGTVCVLEAARLADVRRVVFTSSKSVYALLEGVYGFPTYEPVSEEYPRVPPAFDRAYGSSKVFSEEAGLAFFERYGLEFLALRFATIYGVGKDVRHGSIAVHGGMIERAMRGETTRIAQGGDERDDMLYVKDVAQAVAKACTAATWSHFYNIGTGYGSLLSDLADAVREIYPEADIEIGPGRDYMGYPGTYGVMDISRARRELGYEPEFDLRAGVRDYVETISRLRGEPSPG